MWRYGTPLQEKSVQKRKPPAWLIAVWPRRYTGRRRRRQARYGNLGGQSCSPFGGRLPVQLYAGRRVEWQSTMRQAVSKCTRWNRIGRELGTFPRVGRTLRIPGVSRWPDDGAKLSVLALPCTSLEIPRAIPWSCRIWPWERVSAAGRHRDGFVVGNTMESWGSFSGPRQQHARSLPISTHQGTGRFV